MGQDTPRAATSHQDAQGKQNQYRDGDGIGVVKPAVRSRQGLLGRPMVLVLGASLTLAIIAALVLRIWVGAGHP